jgi:hypothetical protein
MEFLKRYKKHLPSVLILVFFIALLVFSFCLVKRVPKLETKEFGVTYSKIYAEEFDLDWQDIYTKIFNDLNVLKVRIPVYWPEIEKSEGEFDFSWLDWMVNEAESHNAQLILVVGRKVPRWPECHEPKWVKDYPEEKKQELILKIIETTVKRYDSRDVVWAWQVENEPFLPFGICPKLDKSFLDKEITLVKSLSEKPLILTDGGEFGDWLRAYKRADIFGSTLYRHVYTKFIGEWTYPLPSWYFRLKRGFVELFYDKRPTFVAELQTEPWGKNEIRETGLEKQYQLFGPKRFKKMMKYIKGSGFDTFYFWGIEWIYWLDNQGHSEMLDLVKEEINKL